jgi:hypothetical protein
MKAAPLAFLFLLTAASCAQTAEIPKLRQTEKIVVEAEPNGMFVSPIVCDADGNIYKMGADNGTNNKSPVTKVSATGKSVIRFDLNAVTGPQIERAEYFSVTPDGTLYELVSGHQGTHIVRFQSDGTPLSSVLVDRMLYPRLMAIFQSGRFLVSGIRTTRHADGMSLDVPFTALLDHDGKFLRNVTVSDDPDYLRRAVPYDPRASPVASPLNREIEFGERSLCQ